MYKNIEIWDRCKGVHRRSWARAFRIDPNSYEYLVAKIGFDTAENEPCKVCPLSVYRCPRLETWGVLTFSSVAAALLVVVGSGASRCRRDNPIDRNDDSGRISREWTVHSFGVPVRSLPQVAESTFWTAIIPWIPCVDSSPIIDFPIIFRFSIDSSNWLYQCLMIDFQSRVLIILE